MPDKRLSELPSSLAGATTVGLYGYDTNGESVQVSPDKVAQDSGSLQTVATLTELQGLTGMAVNDVRDVTGIGQFQYDGAEWVPIDEIITPQMFGAVADGVYSTRTGTNNTQAFADAAAFCSQIGRKLSIPAGQYLVNGLKLDGLASGYPDYGRIMIEGMGIPGSHAASDTEGVIIFCDDDYAGRVVECVGDWFANTARHVYLKNIRIEAGAAATTALYLEQVTEMFKLENIVVGTSADATFGIQLISCWTGALDLVRATGTGATNTGVGLRLDTEASNPDHFQSNQISMRNVEIRDFYDNERLGGLTLNSSNPIGPITKIACQQSGAARYNQVFGSGIRGIANIGNQNENADKHGAVLLNDCHGVTWDETSWFNNNGIDTGSQYWNVFIGAGAIGGASLAVSDIRIASQFFNCRSGIRVNGNLSGSVHNVDVITIDSPRMTPHSTESLTAISIDSTSSWNTLPNWRYTPATFTANFATANLSDTANNLTWARGTKRQRLNSTNVTTGTISDATQANPVVLTITGHGFNDGESIFINSVSGMTELNGNVYTVANAATNTVELSGIDGTGYTEYTSGGTATEVPVIDPMASDSLLNFTVATSLSQLSGGVLNQKLTLTANNTNATLNQAGNIRLKNNPYAMPNQGQITLSLRSDGTWREESGS